VNLLIQSGRTIDAIPIEGWRMDIGYPDDRDRAEQRLDGEGGATGAESASEV
jgi:glucose-1-phosphate thymidylyltransferase